VHLTSGVSCIRVIPGMHIRGVDIVPRRPLVAEFFQIRVAKEETRAIARRRVFQPRDSLLSPRLVWFLSPLSLLLLFVKESNVKGKPRVSLRAII